MKTLDFTDLLKDGHKLREKDLAKYLDARKESEHIKAIYYMHFFLAGHVRE